MTRLVVEILKRSIASGQNEVHLSFGRDGSKTRWSPRELAYKQYLFVRKALRGRLLAAFYLAFLKWRTKYIVFQSPDASPLLPCHASAASAG